MRTFVVVVYCHWLAACLVLILRHRLPTTPPVNIKKHASWLTNRHVVRCGTHTHTCLCIYKANTYTHMMHTHAYILPYVYTHIHTCINIERMWSVVSDTEVRLRASFHYYHLLKFMRIPAETHKHTRGRKQKSLLCPARRHPLLSIIGKQMVKDAPRCVVKLQWPVWALIKSQKVDTPQCAIIYVCACVCVLVLRYVYLILLIFCRCSLLIVGCWYSFHCYCFCCRSCWWWPLPQGLYLLASKKANACRLPVIALKRHRHTVGALNKFVKQHARLYLNAQRGKALITSVRVYITNQCVLLLLLLLFL